MASSRTVPAGDRRGNQGGFTLIELMVTLVILGLIMSVVYRVFSTQEKFFRTQEQVAAMQENLRASVEYINQELSWLGYRVPGVAVVKAAPTDIIFKANIPNTGATIQYVRYQFNPSTNTISRAAGATNTDVENTDLTVMASDIEALSFSYYNVLNGLLNVDPADPPCADELPAAVCSPGDPDDDATLLMIQRVKARVTARTSRPDWAYTDPEGGANPNFRKRRAVLDLKARNVEDVTLQGGSIGLGSCGSLTHSITVPGGSYDACADRNYQIAFARPDVANNTWDDNPSITINAYDMNGNLNTNPNRVIYVFAVGDDGTPYNIYEPSDPYTVDNTIDNGLTRYVAAQDLSGVAAGNRINLQFAYSDGVCTQVTYPGDTSILIAPSTATHFVTSGAYIAGGLTVSYVDVTTGTDLGLTYPSQVAMCSSVAGQGVLLGAELRDDCDNGISGETITWNDSGAGGTFINETDNGDGTYSATYVPPDAMGTVAASYTVPISAQWGTFSPTVNVDLIAAQPHDVVIDSIVDVTQAGIFQFASTVPSRAAQLGMGTGSSFQIERVDGQEVMVRFHLEDACGNRVYGQDANITVSATTGSLTPMLSSPDGTYTFVWESTVGCGLERTGENFTVSVSTITNPSTQSELVAFDLLTTRSSDPDAGPFVLMDKVPLAGALQAGNTSDFVTIEATVTQYHPELGYCTNIPGVFPVEFTVAGGPGGNGSFTPTSPFDETSTTVDTDAGGLASVQLYSGTADWDDSLTVTATANVDGAVYPGSISVDLDETFHPQTASGFYQDATYTTEIGSDQAVNVFDPGSDLHIQIFDYDENENPLTRDSLAAPYDVVVVVTSALTGDSVSFPLTEWAENTAEFRGALETEFSTFALADDTLQLRDGDTVTMTYEDKDNPADVATWTVYTPNASYFRIYKVDGALETELVQPAGPTRPTVAYGDRLRPKLHFSYLAGDASFEEDTVVITVNSGSGDDTDTLVLREEGDSGVMVPDWTVYGDSVFTVSQTDPGDAADILATPSTPRYVTLDYDAAGSYARSLTFFMKDFDPPAVTITLPSDGSIVSGLVPVIVDASDVANATSWAGISRIDLYVNGRLYQTATGTDLTGANNFTWTTAVGTNPRWLDGSHELTAVAFDASLNEALSAPVGVTVSNNLTPIWFTDPVYNSIWSQNVDIGIAVGNLAAESGTYKVFLSVNGSAPVTSWTGTGDGTFLYTLDSTTVPEGTVGLVATIEDQRSNDFQTTALDFIADRTPPGITIGSPFDQPWLTDFHLPLNVEVMVSDPKVAPADPNDVDDASVVGSFSGACSSPLNMPLAPAGGDSYTLTWITTACDGVEGVLRLTVTADDVATSPNQASRTASTMIDTREPVVDTFTISPMVAQSFTLGANSFDGFIRSDVTLSATATDGYLNTGVFAVWYYRDPWHPTAPPDWPDFRLLGPMDASSGSFSYGWATTSLALPGPYPSGLYIAAASVSDLAGNYPAAPPYKWVYLDNGRPVAYRPDVYLPAGVARGPVYVGGYAEANFGFLQQAEHRYVLSGGNPDNPWEVVHSETVSFPVADKMRTSAGVYVLDTSSWANGTYVAYAYATDWAGNLSAVAPSTSFDVSLKHLDETSLMVTFQETFAGSGLFTAAVTGRVVDNAGYGVANTQVPLMYYNYDRTCMNPPACTVTSLTYVSNTYYSANYTDATGTFTHSAPSPIYHNPTTSPLGSPVVSMSRVYFYNDKGYTDYRIDTDLTDPPDQVNPTVTATYDYRPSSLVSNLFYSMSYAATGYTMSVSGNLIRSDGTPAEYVTMRIRTIYYDTLDTYTATDHYVTTGAYGAFTAPWSPFDEIFPAARSASTPYVYVYFYDDLPASLGYLYGNPVGDPPAPLTNQLR